MPFSIPVMSLIFGLLAVSAAAGAPGGAASTGAPDEPGLERVAQQGGGGGGGQGGQGGRQGGRQGAGQAGADAPPDAAPPRPARTCKVEVVDNYLSCPPSNRARIRVCMRDGAREITFLRCLN